MQNGNNKPQEKRLKVYSKYIPRMIYSNVLFPEIRLCGKWLRETGFEASINKGLEDIKAGRVKPHKDTRKLYDKTTGLQRVFTVSISLSPFCF